MAVQQSIAAFVDSKEDAAPTTEAAPQSDSTTVEQPATTVQASDTAQPAAEEQVPGFVGFTPEQPAEAQTAPEEGGKWTPEVDPETPIFKDANGNPITAKDLQSGFMAQADYTRKTQELAQQRDQLDPQIAELETGEPYRLSEWWADSLPVIQPLYSEDPEDRVQAVMAIAEKFGVADRITGQGGRQRDERGRFVSTTQEAEDEGPTLEEIEAEYGKDSPEYRNAARLERLASQNADLQGKLDKFLGGFQTQAQEQERQSEFDRISADWGRNGFTADSQAASRLVGQQITPEQAMTLANHARLMQHNVNVAVRLAKAQATRTPDEPIAGDRRPVVDAAGKSMTQFVDEKTR